MKLKAQGAAILDPNSDMDEVLESLEELHTIMNELQEKATEYKSYQKQFKVRAAGGRVFMVLGRGFIDRISRLENWRRISRLGFLFVISVA